MKKLIIVCSILFSISAKAQDVNGSIFILYGEIIQDSLFPVHANVVFNNFCANPDSAVRMNNVRFPNAILNENNRAKGVLTYYSTNDSIRLTQLKVPKKKYVNDAWQLIIKTFGSPTDSIVSLVGKRYLWQQNNNIKTLAQLDRITGRLWFKSYLKL